MAGWSLLDDVSTLDIVVTPSKFKPEGFFVDLRPISEGGLVKVEANPDNISTECVLNGFSNNLQCDFDNFLRGVLEEIYSKNYFRPMPPMLGNGQQVNLQKLFVVVKQKGGYDAVSENRLWDLVAQESGLGVNVGSSVKLIYNKYLNTLDSWLKRAANSNVSDTVLSDIGAEFSRRLMDLQTGVEGLLSELSDQDGSDDKCRCLGLKRKLDYNDVQILCETNKVRSMTVDVDEDQKFQGGRQLGLDMPDCSMNESRVGNLCNNVNSMERLQEFDEGKKSVNNKEEACLDDATKVSVNNVPEVGSMCYSNEVNNTLGLSDGSMGCGSNDDNALILDPSIVDKGSFGHKRKRESVWEILKWVTGIAKNPSDPSSGSIPERSKWKSHSSEETWKKVLLFREAVFLKRHAESSDEQLNWQSQRMHPCLYDDHIGTAYNLRERLKHDKRLISGTRADSSLQIQSDLERSPSAHIEFHCDKFPRLPIPLGPGFQAQVPEWTGVASESDPIWLGTQIWPSKNVNNKLLIERDPIGKGRQDSCGCRVPGSVECVRFHIAEKRAKVKLELGFTFLEWNFDRVGEEVRQLWTQQEEKKFRDIVHSNPASTDCSFWDYIFRSFPTKTRENLVSYYFNVFLLQNRAYQNRHTPDDIDSDDDGSESGPMKNVFGHLVQNSLRPTLLSPKKPQVKC